MLRLCGSPRRLAAAAALVAALTAGGCSYQLETAFSKSDSEVTGSTSAPHPQAVGPKVSEADLAYARAAVADALERGKGTNSVPWRNPQTGVGGNITPLSTAYSEGGQTCRNFLASYATAGSQAWLSGSACRTARGEWQVKALKPLGAG